MAEGHVPHVDYPLEASQLNLCHLSINLLSVLILPSNWPKVGWEDVIPTPLQVLPRQEFKWGEQARFSGVRTTVKAQIKY